MASMARLVTVSTRFCSCLQRHSPLWPVALGMLCGAGMGATALWGLGGVIGAGVCLIVVGTVYWVAQNADPVWLDEATWSQPAKSPDPEPPPLHEPLAMVALPAGTFMMGAPATDTEALADERPQHAVTISALWMSRYPITWQRYRDVMGRGLRQWEGAHDDGQWPANYVSWIEAVAFCNALSERVGLQPCYRIVGTDVTWDTTADGYRLPTEAEWEYACRAGTTTRRFWGDDDTAMGRYAWFVDNAGHRVHPVGEKAPNSWGLYDMLGNVWEWCWDWYGPYEAVSVSDPIGLPEPPAGGFHRVLRGGSAWNAPWYVRSSLRTWYTPERRDDDDGFRCVRRPRRQP